MADIVKLIYKGDEMSQWGWSGSSNVEVLPITTVSDITWAQAVLDAVLAGKYVIVEFKSNASSTTKSYLYLSNSTTGATPRLRFVGMWYTTWSWSTQEPVTWTQTWQFISLDWINIWYNWTTVSEVTRFQNNEIRVSGYTE